MKPTICLCMIIVLFLMSIISAGSVNLYDFQIQSDGTFSYQGGNSALAGYGKSISFLLSETSVLDESTISAVNDVISEHNQNNLVAVEEVTMQTSPIALQNVKKALFEFFKKNPDTTFISDTESLKRLKEFAQMTKRDLQLEITDSETIIFANNELFAQIPQGYSIQNAGDFLEVINEKNVKTSMQFGSLTIPLKQGSVILSEANKIKKMIMKNKGDVLIGQTAYNAIEEAIFEIDDKGMVLSAQFISVDGGAYTFNNNGILYIFNAQKRGKVIYDIRNNKITGEKTTLSVSYGENSLLIDSTKKFSVSLDENGNPSRVILEEGGSFNFKKGGVNAVVRSTKGQLTVFLDGENIRSFSGNAVSINPESDVIFMRGFVAMNLKGTTINYEGKSADAFTLFDHFNNRHFDVEVGSAIIDNGRHEILFERGESKMRLKSNAFDHADDFSFSSHGSEGVVRGFVNEINNEFRIESYDNEGNLKTVSVPLSRFQNAYTGIAGLSGISQQNVELVLQQKLEEINTRMNELENQGLQSSLEYEQLQLQKIIAEKNIAKINGDPLHDSIAALKNFVQQTTDQEMRSSGQLILAEALMEDANRKDVPKLYTLTEIPLAANAIPKSIDFEVVDGKITAVVQDGKRLPLTLNKEIVKSQLSLPYPGMEQAIDRIYEQNDLETLQSLNKDLVRIIETDINKNSPYYADLQKQYDEVRTLLTELKGIEKYSGVSQLLLAQSYGKLEGANKVAEELELVIQTSDDYAIRSEAARLIGMTLYADDPRKNAAAAMIQLERAMQLGNAPAAENLAAIKISLLNDRMHVYNQEPEQLLNDMYDVLGAPHDDSWLQRISEGVFHPASGNYYLASGRAEQLLRTQQRLLDENNQRILGASALKNLIESNVDPQIYASASVVEKVSEIARSEGLDRLVSVDELESYIVEAGVDFSEQGYHQQMQRLFETIQAERGPEVANQYFQELSRILITASAVDRFITQDPAGYLLANNGNSLEYTGTSSLENAFTTDRSGETIERNFVESGVLQVSDFAVSTIALAGTLKAAGIAAEAAGAGRVFSVARSVLSPAETLAVTTIGETAPKTALAVGLVGEVGTQMVIGQAIGLVSPTGKEVYDLISIFGGSEASIGKNARVSVVEDAAGNVKMFVQAEGEEAQQVLRNKLEILGVEGDDVVTVTMFPHETHFSGLSAQERDIFEQRVITLRNIAKEITENPGSINSIKEFQQAHPEFNEIELKRISSLVIPRSFIDEISQLPPAVQLDRIDDYFNEFESPALEFEPRAGGRRTVKYYDIAVEESDGTIRNLDDSDVTERKFLIENEKANLEEFIHATQHSGKIVFVSPYTYSFYEDITLGKHLGLFSEDEFNKMEESLLEVDIAAFFSENNPKLVDDNFLDRYFGRDDFVELFFNRKKIFISPDAPTTGNIIATGTIDDLIEANSARAAAGQEALSNLRTLEPDLPQSEIARITGGRFTEQERLRIERATQILLENGLSSDADLLRSPEMQQQLLISHYSGNNPDGVNVFTKARPLLQNGFTRESIELLMAPENMIGVTATGNYGDTIFQTQKPWLDTRKVDDFVNYPDEEISHIRKKVVDNLRVVSFEEFYDNVRKSTLDVNQLLIERNEPYVRLYGKDSSASPRWVAELSDEYLTARPSDSNYFVVSRELTFPTYLPNAYLPSEGSNMERWLEQGIKTFVYFDDASYSGTQIKDVVEPLLQVYTKYTDEKATLYIVVPYMTEFAEKEIQSLANPHYLDVKIIKQEKIKTIDDILTAEEKQLYMEFADLLHFSEYASFSKYFSDYRPGVTAFDHKLPDSFSFDPQAYDLFYKPSQHTPVYKQTSQYSFDTAEEYEAYRNSLPSVKSDVKPK